MRMRCEMDWWRIRGKRLLIEADTQTLSVRDPRGNMCSLQIMNLKSSHLCLIRTSKIMVPNFMPMFVYIWYTFSSILLFFLALFNIKVKDSKVLHQKWSSPNFFHQSYQIKWFRLFKFHPMIYLFWLLKSYDNFLSFDEIWKTQITLSDDRNPKKMSFRFARQLLLSMDACWGWSQITVEQCWRLSRLVN